MKPNPLKTVWSRFANDLRLVFLLPFIVLVWLTEWLDPKLWRHWNMHSLQNWRQFRWDWKAYAIAALGWCIAAVLACQAVHYLQAR
jgi:hypothetical protein